MSQTSRVSSLLCLLLTLSSYSAAQQITPTSQKEDYLSWTAKQATQIGRKWRVAGRVGWGHVKWELFYSGVYFYELRATLMTPEAIRAAARLEQLKRNLTDSETRELVMEAQRVDGLVAYIELNPREGSGVIPSDWVAILRPKGAKDDSPLAIAGTDTPALRHIKALTRVGQRDYLYDEFWVVFPLKDKQGKLIWETPPGEIELVVRINDLRGRVSWRVNESLRQRLLSSGRQGDGATG
jgi:hypothetical protein